MNVAPLIKAVELLDCAIGLTPERSEREAIERAAAECRSVLQRRGVFVGTPNGKVNYHEETKTMEGG